MTMRRVGRAMLFGTVGTVGVGTALGGYGHYLTRQASTAAAPVAGPEVDGKTWNSLQDTAALDRSFKSAAALRQSGLIMYTLLGCPYCARVRATLDYADIPYTLVVVDPVNFQELNSMPYKCCPQVQCAKPVGGTAPAVDTTATPYPITKRGPFIVESDLIIDRVAKATGQKTDTAAIREGRQWITEIVSRLVFISGGKSLSRAYGVMAIVTPEKYHNPLARLGGAIPMWLLGKYKTTGRVIDAYQARGETITKEEFDADRALQKELKAFGGKLSASNPFHGGKAPDLVDVELFGLLRSQIKHAPISGNVNASGLDQWYVTMDKKVGNAALTNTNEAPEDVGSAPTSS